MTTTDPTNPAPSRCAACGGTRAPDGHCPGCRQAVEQALARIDNPNIDPDQEPTGRPPRVDGADLVIRDLRQQLVAARQETARVRSQLAEAREQRDHAQRWNDEARRAWAVDSAELAVVRGELAAAREAYQRLAEAAQTVADALEAATGGILESAGHLRDLLARALAATAPEHEHRDECERCDHLDGSICPECPLAAPSAPETAEPCPRWHTTAVDAAKAVARELGVQAVIAGELVDAVNALKAEREMAEQDRDLARQAAEGRQRERAAHEQGADLWTAEDWVDWLRKRVRLAMDLLSRVLATTAPETAPESPQTGEQTQVWADTHTGAETGSQGPLDLDAIRAAWLRVCGSCDAGYPTACTCPPGDPRAIIAALVAELDQLRAEWSALRGQVGRAIVLCGPRGDKPIDVIVASVIDDLEEARQENADLRAQLAEARQQRDQAAEALVAAQTEGDEAWDRLSNLVDELAGALEMDGTPDDHEIIREARALGQLRVELAALRAEREWLADRARQMGIADVIIATYGPAHAISAEVGRLRAEIKRLSARVREWEAVNADLAARCDSGDIPIRLGERYSLAVLREIDRLRADDLAIRRILRDYGASVGGTDPLPAIVAEILDAARRSGAELVTLRDRHEQVCEELAEARRGCERLRAERDALRAEVERAREIAHSYRHEIGAAQVFDVLEAALGSTPDTGSTT